MPMKIVNTGSKRQRVQRMHIARADSGAQVAQIVGMAGFRGDGVDWVLASQLRCATQVTLGRYANTQRQPENKKRSFQAALTS